MQVCTIIIYLTVWPFDNCAFTFISRFCEVKFNAFSECFTFICKKKKQLYYNKNYDKFA